MELHPTANAVRFRCGDRESGVVRMIPETIRFHRQEAEHIVTYTDSELFDRQSSVGEMLLHCVHDGAIKVELLRDNCVLLSPALIVERMVVHALNSAWKPN